jgi:hypothetical protein
MKRTKSGKLQLSEEKKMLFMILHDTFISLPRYWLLLLQMSRVVAGKHIHC